MKHDIHDTINFDEPSADNKRSIIDILQENML